MYIAFEGIDGSGKSTIIDKIKCIIETNYPVEVIKEPSYSDVGILAKNRLNDLSNDGMFEVANLMAADRNLILKNLDDENKIVLSDRSFVSSLVYQVDNTCNIHDIRMLNRYAINKITSMRSILIYVDTDPDIANSRISNYRSEIEKIEKIEIQRKIYENYKSVFRSLFYEGKPIFNTIISISNNRLNNSDIETISELIKCFYEYYKLIDEYKKTGDMNTLMGNNYNIRIDKLIKKLDIINIF